MNFVHRLVENNCHALMHQCRIVPFDKERLVAVADEQRSQLVLGDARQNGGIGDLVAIQMQDRQNGAVARRVQELVRMPCGRQRPGFSFSIADHAGNDEVRIVKGRTKGMGKSIAEFAALMDGSRHIGRGMAGYTARERKLPEQFLHSRLIERDVWIEFTIRAFEIGIGDHCRAAMARPTDIDDVLVACSDNAVQMGVDETQAW